MAIRTYTVAVTVAITIDNGRNEELGWDLVENELENKFSWTVFDGVLNADVASAAIVEYSEFG